MDHAGGCMPAARLGATLLYSDMCFLAATIEKGTNFNKMG